MTLRRQAREKKDNNNVDSTPTESNDTSLAVIDTEHNHSLPSSSPTTEETRTLGSHEDKAGLDNESIAERMKKKTRPGKLKRTRFKHEGKVLGKERGSCEKTS